MAQIAVTLELADYGMTPGSEWVEARTLRKGFSVVVRDDYIFKRASRRYSSREGYNWRAFARCLPGLCEPEKINPDNDAARMIQVKGEVGLVAEILRFAYASGNAGMPEFVDLLIDQTDDCLLQAERITGGHLSAETQALLSEIDGNIRELKLDHNLCSLVRTVTGRDQLDLEALSNHLETLAEDKRRQDAEQRENIIRPFRESIELKIRKFDGRGVPTGYPSKKSRMRSFLESYVLSYGRLPSGEVHVKSPPGSSMSWDLGIINFEED